MILIEVFIAVPPMMLFDRGYSKFDANRSEQYAMATTT